MSDELQKLADKHIEQVEKERGAMTAFDKERVYYLVERAALQGIIDDLKASNERNKKQLGPAG